MALIETRDLRRVYDLDAGRVVALDAVSLDIDKGDFVAVMGPSGSGKSTFMNLIGCLDRPTGGHYRLNGTAVESLDADGLARLRNREIGFVFQQFNLLPRVDALGNVELPMVYAGFDRRTRRVMGAEEWHRLAARTSLVPCAALVGGRWRPVPGRLSWRRLALAVLLYAALLALHQPVIGVSPQPVL